MDSGGPKQLCIKWDPDPPTGRSTFEGDDVGFFPNAAVHCGLDVGISPHAVDQHSDWPAAETVECHIKFSQ